MQDWNWFFSSIAQCAAAIVGVFGAFIVSKLIGTESDARRLHARATDLLTSAKALKDRLDARHFEWYNQESLALAANRLRLAAQSSGGSLDPTERLDLLDISPFIPRALVIEQLKSSLGPALHANTAGHQTTELSLDLSVQLREERRRIEELVAEAKHLVSEIQSCRGAASALPSASRLLVLTTAALGCLFLAGVVYPLSLLPSSSPPTLELSVSAVSAAFVGMQGLLLGAMAALFCGLLAYLSAISLRLGRPVRELLDLAKYTSLAGYSEYLAVMVENERRLSPLTHRTGRSEAAE